MRAFTVTMMVSAAALWSGAGCGDDASKPDGGDTLVDGSDAVDTADTGGDDTAGDSADDTSDTGGDTSGDSAVETSDSDVTPVLAVVLNELGVTGSDPDWVELYNGGSTVADISGWVLTDDDVENHRYTFPPSTIISAGAYLVVERDDLGGGFAFGYGDADGAFLYQGDTLVDSTVWNVGEAPLGATWGRFPSGTGPFMTLWKPSKGTVNLQNDPSECGNDTLEAGELCDGTKFGAGIDCADFGWGGGTLGCSACERYDFTGCTEHAAALVINELTSEADDQIELFNGGVTAVALGGYTLTDGGGGSYVLPAQELAAGAYLVLVKDTHHTFGLGDEDSLELTDTNGELVDRAAWGVGFAAVSYCRMPNGVGGFKACDNQSFGAANF